MFICVFFFDHDSAASCPLVSHSDVYLRGCISPIKYFFFFSASPRFFKVTLPSWQEIPAIDDFPSPLRPQVNPVEIRREKLACVQSNNGQRENFIVDQVGRVLISRRHPSSDRKSQAKATFLIFISLEVDSLHSPTVSSSSSLSPAFRQTSNFE